MAKSKKFLNGILSLILSAVAIFEGYKLLQTAGVIGGNRGDSTASKTQSLSKVSNVAFDKDTNLLSWDSVANADSYIVDINGKQTTVNTNSMSYIPSSEVTEFKIKAVDSTGDHFASDWSDTYTHTIENTFNLAKVYNYVNEMIDGTSLEKIVSIYVRNGYLNTNCVMSDGYLYTKKSSYDTAVTSIADAITHNDLIVHRTIESYHIANYDSVSYLLRSNSLCGQLEEYRQNGYDISVISSQALKAYNYDNVVYVFATYKLDNGIDTKYVQSEIKCIIQNPSATESINFTTKLLTPTNRKLKERSFVELTGDAEQVAKWMEASMLASKADLQDRMEY